MAAVREVSVKQGQDPRDFPLVTAGGTGPNHACMIALELEMPVFLVPGESSIFCAAGMLMSDLKHDFVQTYAVRMADIDTKRFKDYFYEMRKEGIAHLKGEGIPEDKIEFVYPLDIRYIKQYHKATLRW